MTERLLHLIFILVLLVAFAEIFGRISFYMIRAWVRHAVLCEQGAKGSLAFSLYTFAFVLVVGSLFVLLRG
jgi:hypothetical protein